jgi:hypothetical protein
MAIGSRRRREMTDREAPDNPPERIPLAQIFFDNIFLLLVLGLAVPIVFYTIWGLLEIASIPLAAPIELPK